MAFFVGGRLMLAAVVVRRSGVLAMMAFLVSLAIVWLGIVVAG